MWSNHFALMMSHYLLHINPSLSEQVAKFKCAKFLKTSLDNQHLLWLGMYDFVFLFLYIYINYRKVANNIMNSNI